MEAQGSVLTNMRKVTGGRYYGGCEYVDIAEDQPENVPNYSVQIMPMFSHSCQCNMAVYLATLKPGDTVQA